MAGSARRKTGWLAVAAVSVVSNLTWFAAARRFPNGPVGQLTQRILRKKASAS